MRIENKTVKTNEQFLTELNEGKISPLNIISTPYENLRILLDTSEVSYSYRDEDWDLIHSTETIIDRKALLKYEEGNYSFLFDNWFDDVDNFETGLYAKVRLGGFYNLVNPLGEYLFPNWFGDIEFHGNNLIYSFAYTESQSDDFRDATTKQDQQVDRVCSIYDRRGNLLLKNVIVKTEFSYGQAIIFKDGLFNYINEDGQLLMDEWLLDAQAFEKMKDGVFAFVKTERGWGVLDPKGFFAYSPRFSSIRKFEWDSSPFDREVIPIVEDDKGQNILMGYDRNDESKMLILGLSDSVDSIVLIGGVSEILVKQGREWSLFKWDNNNHHFDCSINLGELDSVDDKLLEIFSSKYRLIQKEHLFNIVGRNGLFFNEWYAEISVIGNFIKVKRSADALKVDTDSTLINDKPLFEYNLATVNRGFILDDWCYDLKAAPVRDNCFLIVWIYGKCNLIGINGEYILKEWMDDIKRMPAKGSNDYLMVYRGGKCNLIDENGTFLSPEWVDDFYWSDLMTGAFVAVKENRRNLLFCGKFIFNQWFSHIERYFDEFDDDRGRQRAFFVRDENRCGIYYLKTGLIGGCLYDSIRKISKTLYFARSGDNGHIITQEGRIITTAPIREVYPFNEGYARVTNAEPNGNNGYQYNYLNVEGKLVSPIWFDSDFYTPFGCSDIDNTQFYRVYKDYKCNLITEDKQLLFKNWYDSIEGNDGKWLISDMSRGNLKFNFIDNEERLLSDQWFESVKRLRNLDQGVYAVKTELGYNVFNGDNEITLPNCVEGIYDDDFSGLAVVVERSRGYRHNYFLDHSGHLITPYWSFFDDMGSFYDYYRCDNNEDLSIINLCDGDCSDVLMQILCKRDGTPFFKDIIHLPYSPYTLLSYRTGAGDYISSVFGRIRECSVPGKDPVLLVDKHWPHMLNDKRRYVVLNYEGKELSEEFEYIGKFDDNGYALVQRCGQYNIIDNDFHLVSSLWFDNLGYEYKSKETEYDEIFDYETGRMGSIPSQVEKIRRNTSFHNGHIKVELAGSFNLMDQTGRLKFPIWYDSLISLPYGYYRAGLNGLFNVVDASNRPLSDVWFDRMRVCKRDDDMILYCVQKGPLYRLLFLSKTTALLSDDWFDKVFKYDKMNDYYPVRLEGKKNFVTDEGKLLVPGWHDEQLLFRDNSCVYVVVKDENKFNIYSSRQSGFLSANGFENVLRGKGGLFNYGWCGVQVDGKYSFINEKGLLAEGRFDLIREYRFGFAGVVLDGKKNYLSSDGTLLSDVWFEEISPFESCGKAVVKINGRFNVIDSTGSLLLSDDIQNVSAIDSITSDYCLMSLAVEYGITVKKYYDFSTAQLYDSEKSLRESREMAKADATKIEKHSEADDTEGDEIVVNPAVTKRNSQIHQLVENTGIPGINYTLVKFGDKSNLVDKSGTLVFVEWIDSSFIQMRHGVPLMMNADNKWVIVK